MSPTNSSRSQGIITSTSTEVSALPMPDTSPLSQPWPTFSVDQKTRLAVSSGHLPKLRLQTLFTAAAPTPHANGVAATTLRPPHPTVPAATAGASSVSAMPGALLRVAGPMTAPGSSPGTPTQASARIPLSPPQQTHRTQLTQPAPPGTAAVVPLVQPGTHPASVSTHRSGISVEALASRSVRFGGLGLGLSIMALLIALGISGSAGWILLVSGIMLSVATSVPAIVIGRRSLAGANPVWTPERIRKTARLGMRIGWISTAIWLVSIVIVLAHAL